jgi:hypothetical protein
MLRHFFLGILFLLTLTGLNAQVGGIKEEVDTLRNHFSFGGKILTRGWELGLQFERARVKGRHQFILHLSHLKETGEIRRESLFQASEGTRFVMNKVNYLIPLHLGYGRSITLVPKTRFSKVRLAASLTLGPTLGIVAPYSVYKFVPFQGNPELGYREVSTFYEQLSYEEVIGEVGFVSGARSARYQMGLTGIAGLQLDMGEKHDFIRAATVSLRADFFPGKVELIRDQVRQVLISGGIGVLIGNAW